MKRTIFIISLLLCLPLAAQQTYRARVVDAETGEALPYVNIYVASERGTMTNAEGHFLIQAGPAEQLTFRYVGYETVQVAASGLPSVIKMKPYAKELNQYLMLTTNLLGSPNMNLWTARPSSYNVTYGINGVLSFNESPNWAECFIRDISTEQESLDTLNCDNAIGELEDTIGSSHLITIRGKNYLPKILPLYIKGRALHGKHYLFAKDVVCVKDESNTIFESDADYTFEKNGTFRIDKGVTIKRGAHVKIISSEINY